MNAAGVPTEYTKEDVIDLLCIVATTGSQINKVPSSIPIYQEYKAAAGPGTPPCYYSTLKLFFSKEEGVNMDTEIMKINMHEIPIKALQEYYSRQYSEYYVKGSSDKDPIKEVVSKYITYSMSLITDAGTVANNYQHIFVHKEILVAIETEITQLKEKLLEISLLTHALPTETLTKNFLDIYGNYLISLVSELARHHYAQLLHNGTNTKNIINNSSPNKIDPHRFTGTTTGTLASKKLFESYQLNVFKNKNGNKNVNFLRPQEYVRYIVIDNNTSLSLDRSYVTSLTLIPNCYLPQVGDEIIYYASGHRDYLKYFPDYSGNKKNRSGLVKKKGNNERIPCRILTVDYEFPSTLDNGIICVIQLGALGIPGLKQFFITYRPGHVLGEFLISRNNLQNCLLRNWQKNMVRYSLLLTITHSLLLTHSLTYLLTITHPLTYSLIYLLTHSFTYSLTHSYSLTHLLTHSYSLLLTHSLTP